MHQLKAVKLNQAKYTRKGEVKKTGGRGNGIKRLDKLKVQNI